MSLGSLSERKAIDAAWASLTPRFLSKGMRKECFEAGFDAGRKFSAQRVKGKAQVVQECINRLGPLEEGAPVSTCTAAGDVIRLLRDLRDFYERGER